MFDLKAQTTLHSPPPTQRGPLETLSPTHLLTLYKLEMNGKTESLRLSNKINTNSIYVKLIEFRLRTCDKHSNVHINRHEELNEHRTFFFVNFSTNKQQIISIEFVCVQFLCVCVCVAENLKKFDIFTNDKSSPFIYFFSVYFRILFTQIMFAQCEHIFCLFFSLIIPLFCRPRLKKKMLTKVKFK